MEKNIHTSLFDSAVSVKEQRFVFLDGTPEVKTQEHFDATVEKIKKNIDDPSASSAELEKNIRVLQLSAMMSETKNANSFAEIQKLMDVREQADKSLEKIRASTVKGTAEWDAMVEAVKNKEGTDAEQKTQVAAAKKFIEKELAGIQGLLAAKKPYNYLMQIQAHNDNIVKTKGLDSTNAEIEGSLGVAARTLEDADKKLQSIDTDHGTYMLTLEPLLKTAEEVELSKNPAARGAAEDAVDISVKAQKSVLEKTLAAISSSGQHNVEKQIAKIFENMKNIDDVVKARLNRKTPPATVLGGSAPETVKTTVDADKVLTDQGIDTALVDALTGAKDAAAQAKALEALNSNVKIQTVLKVPEDAKALADALNTKLGKAGSTFKIDVKDGKLVAKTETTVAAEAATKDVAENRETNDSKSLLKAIVDFLREIAQELKMMRGELLGEKADPAKVTAANAPTRSIVAAEAATRKEFVRAKTVQEEAKARERKATNPAEKRICREELDAAQRKLDELQSRLNRLKQEHAKSEQKDRYVDQRVSTLQKEAERRRAPFTVSSDATKRSILIEAKSRSHQGECAPFLANIEREFGSAVVREKGGARINTYNIQVGNNNVIQNQVTTGGSAFQAQGVEQRAGAEAPSVAQEAVQRTESVQRTVQEEAAARPRARVIKNEKATGSLE